MHGTPHLTGIAIDNIMKANEAKDKLIAELEARKSELEESCVTSAICIKEILESYINFSIL